MGSLESRLSGLERKWPRPPHIPTLEELGIIDDIPDTDDIEVVPDEQQFNETPGHTGAEL